MTIDDQIRDEKLQYDMNREAALSSDKIDKYEYLTDEEILLSNQQKIIKQAKFTYSSLGKAFQKQIKTIEDQGQKQVETLKGLKPETIKSESNNQPIITQEIYDILDERVDEILEMSREINYDNLVYNFKGDTALISFIIFGGPVYTYDQLKESDKTLQQVEQEQKKLKSDLNEIERGSKKSENKKITIKNVKNLYNSR